MSELRKAAQQALGALEEIHPANMTPMAEQAWNKAITALRAALAQERSDVQPEPEPFFTAANGFPQTFVSKDRQKNAIISLTEQCADLIRERDELQKQVWLYEKNGVTCQTYRHTIEQSCAECNVRMSYTDPPQRKPLTDELICGPAFEALRTAIEQQDRAARRTVTYVCPVCAASLERQE